MEHRYEMHEQSEPSVEVAAFGRHFGRHCARYVNHREMFIECELLPVRPSQVVKLTLSHHALRFDLRAVVTHRSNRGIRVMYLDHDDEFSRLVASEIGVVGPSGVRELPVPVLEDS